MCVLCGAKLLCLNTEGRSRREWTRKRSTAIGAVAALGQAMVLDCERSTMIGEAVGSWRADRTVVVTAAAVGLDVLMEAPSNNRNQHKSLINPLGFGREKCW
jgi:hypothetical protein